MSQRMGGCAAAWQAVRGAPESREHVVTGTGVAARLGRGVPVDMKALAPHFTVVLWYWKNWLALGTLGKRCKVLRALLRGGKHRALTSVPFPRTRNITATHSRK